MISKIYDYLNKPYAVVLVMLIAPLFGFMDRNFVFFFGLGVAFLILRGSNYDWARFGIGQKITGKTVVKSLAIAIVLFIVLNIFIGPIVQDWFGDYNLSSVEHIKGNLVGYLIILVVVWVFAAFGEEFLFRGYYMKALAELLGNNNKAWLLSALITSLYFAVSHIYQGIAGVISVFLWSFIVSLLFTKHKTNLLLLVLIHGFYDSIGVTLIFLNMDEVLFDWIEQLF